MTRATDYQRTYHRGSGYWRQRERLWARRGVIEEDGGPLRAIVYLSVLRFQRDRCALSGAKEHFVRFVADHDRKTGLFRGVLSQDVNHLAVGTFERRGRYRDDVVEDAIRNYLEWTPYQQWLDKTGGLRREAPC